jgi:hypothetical protein
MRHLVVLFVAALATGALTLSANAQAQAVPGGARLGMTVPQLRHAVPSLQRVPRPTRLSGGLAGSWSAPPLHVAGVALKPTVYFAAGELRRVEYLATDPAPSAFGALRKWGRARWGAELGAWDPDASFASWASDDVDAYLQRSGPKLRLVLKRRELKDASEL